MGKNVLHHFPQREDFSSGKNILPLQGRSVFPISSKEKLGNIFFPISPKGNIFLPQGRILFPSREERSSLLHLKEVRKDISSSSLKGRIFPQRIIFLFSPFFFLEDNTLYLFLFKMELDSGEAIFSL